MLPNIVRLPKIHSDVHSEATYNNNNTYFYLFGLHSKQYKNKYFLQPKYCILFIILAFFHACFLQNVLNMSLRNMWLLLHGHLDPILQEECNKKVHKYIVKFGNSAAENILKVALHNNIFFILLETRSAGEQQYNR